MIVCHCHRVTHRDIDAAIEGGARSAEELGKACGAGTCCGGCRPTIDGLLSARTLTARSGAKVPGARMRLAESA